MANSLSANLVLDTVSRRTLTQLGNVFAPFVNFATEFSGETFYQQQSVRVPIATAGATSQTNATNWESGDSTLTNINVTMNQISQSWHITPLQLNNGFKLEQLVDINLQVFSNTLWDTMVTPMSGVNFTNFIEPSATFSATNLKTIRAAIAKSPMKNILLDPAYYAQFLPASLTTEIGPRAGLAGFDSFAEVTRWNGAGTNVIGFAGGRNALAIITGLPVMDDETRDDINSTTITVPLGGKGTGQADSGPSVQVVASTWLSRATRLRWASLDIMLGAAKADNSAARVIKSGGSA